jgi:hypothetical protein
MDKFFLKCFCNVCGTSMAQDVEVPGAPEMVQKELTCPKCGDKTHVLLTSCPSCHKSFRYFFSDLDFTDEMLRVSEAYIELIRGIRDSLAEYISEFEVPLPKRWSVKLRCECGNDYSADIALPKME